MQIINVMKIYLLFSLLGFMVFNTQKSEAQVKNVKKDTVYYLLDTLAVPIKDRMFKVEREGTAVFFLLKCKCYPFSTDIPFYYDVYRKKENRIKKTEFDQIRTVPITQLIEIAIKCLEAKQVNNYEFIFIEPDGAKMKLIHMTLGPPYNPRETITVETIKPDGF